MHLVGVIPASSARTATPTLTGNMLDAGQLCHALERGRLRAKECSRSVLVSVVRAMPVRDPLNFFANNSAGQTDGMFWAQPASGFSMATHGVAWSVTTFTANRFADAAAAWSDCCKELLLDTDAGDGGLSAEGTGPVVLGGFAFDPLRPSSELWRGYPHGLLVLPRFLLTQRAGRAWLTVNAVVEPDEDLDLLHSELLSGIPHLELTLRSPSALAPAASDLGIIEDVGAASVWQANVESLKGRIGRGDVSKVVLARSLRVSAQRGFDRVRVLRRLSEEYPDCFVYAVNRGEKCFLGASPERLVKLRHGALQATCLAGSSPRGTTGAADRELERALLASHKERSEHAIVAGAIREALVNADVLLEPSGAPGVMKMRNVQHLYTPITGRTRPGQTILDLVERLHPTPAVGGYPRAAALAAIRELENLDRGWYAGPVGWMDARGDGEFSVAIRSALLDGDHADLFAGCGIVEESEPEREFAESCLKMRPMRSALERSAR